MEERELLIPKKKEKNIIYQYLNYFYNQIRETIYDIKNRKVSYILGLSSCIIVVWMCLISFSALDQIPLIFLRLAELQSGEYDLNIKMNHFMKGSFLNYTLIKNITKGKEDSPRYFENIEIYSTYNCTGYQIPIDLSNETLKDPNHWSWMYYGKYKNDTCKNRNCIEKYCNSYSLKSFLWIIDSEKEKKMGFGREWPYPKIPKGSVYITEGISKILNLNQGDVLMIQMKELNSIYQNIHLEIPDSTLIPFQISKIIEKPFGKFSNENISAILIEYETFIEYIYNFIDPNYNLTQRIEFSKINFYDYSTDIYYNLPNRIEYYKESDYDKIQTNLINFSSKIMYFLGFNQIDSRFPILNLLFNFRFLSLFLGLIITIIITILSILSIILIYSLLLINVETRTFELGVLRLMGMSKMGIIIIVLLKSFSYSLPGWLFGLIFGQLSYLFISQLLSYYLEIQLNYFLSIKSILISSLIGLIIPILSSILPILSAFQLSLNESLDTIRSKSKAVKYSIERSSDGGIHWPTIIIGSVGTIFGFSIYYFMPLSLLSFNLTLLLYLFFGILLSMLLGLVLLSLNLETLLESILTFFFFWENQGIQEIVKKNLISHRIRNRKTTIMFSLSLAFIIFISISFDLQTQSVRYETLQRFGTRINLITLSSLKNHFNKINLLKNEKYIQDITMISNDLRSQTGLSNTIIFNLGRTKRAINSIKAILPNYFKVTGDQFLKKNLEKKSGWDLSQQLYSKNGSQSIILGTTFEKLMNLNLNSIINLDLIINNNRTSRLLLKPLAFLSVSPGFRFSQFPLITNQDALISFPTFKRLSKYSNHPISSIYDIHIERILISLKSDVTFIDIENFKILISKLNLPVRVLDVEENLKLLSVASNVMFFFFIFTTFISMFMCFFSLAASMYSNIFEQAKEIGILRAIGTRIFIIIRIYIYESFILILTSGIMGTFIGMILSYTMSIQRTLFTQLPIPFIIPWQIIITIFFLAIFFSFLSSFFPIFILLRMNITDIMKNLN